MSNVIKFPTQSRRTDDVSDTSLAASTRIAKAVSSIVKSRQVEAENYFQGNNRSTQNNQCNVITFPSSFKVNAPDAKIDALQVIFEERSKVIQDVISHIKSWVHNNHLHV